MISFFIECFLPLNVAQMIPFPMFVLLFAVDASVKPRPKTCAVRQGNSVRGDLYLKDLRWKYGV